MSSESLRRSWRPSLRARLAASTIFAVACALGVGFVWARQNLHSLLIEQVDDVLANKFKELAAVASGSAAALSKELEREIEVYERVEMTVRVDFGAGRIMIAPDDHDGRRIAASLAMVIPGEVGWTAPATGGIPPLRALSERLAVPNEPPALMTIAMSLDRTYETIRMFDRRVMLGGLALLAIAVPIGLWLYRQALRPVTSAVRAAGRLDPQDLSARLPEGGSGDEFDQLARLINELLAKLEQHQARVTKFTADASHELRTPLAAMKTAIDVALQRRRGADEQQTTLGAIGEQCDRLAGVVDKLQLLARADAGHLRVRREPVDFGRLIDETVDFLSPLAEENGLGVRKTIDANAWVEGDQSYLRQVVVNLIDNAIKFTPQGGRIDVTLRTEARRVELAVADSGPGVPAGELPSLFERFYRSDSARLQKGSGLGLSICRSIVELHGGSISAANLPGGGGLFTVVLPRCGRPTEASSP